MIRKNEIGLFNSTQVITLTLAILLVQVKKRGLMYLSRCDGNKKKTLE